MHVHLSFASVWEIFLERKNLFSKAGSTVLNMESKKCLRVELPCRHQIISNTVQNVCFYTVVKFIRAVV